jgi:hypothetical protein
MNNYTIRDNATTFVRISKRAAQKLFAEGNKQFCLCPHKLRPGFPFAPHVSVCGKEYLEDAKRYETNVHLWKGTIEKTAWDLMYNNWAYYNASYEAGYYAAYYVER